MCGISGIFNRNGKPAPIILLKKMASALHHRGPDGEGYWCDNHVGFSHRRLAVIDLSPAGNQPMQTEDGQFTITYNGEIYNHCNLRSELESLGYQFHSKTDTEVVLKSYKQWGKDCLQKFNGMFAFAIWDKSQQQLFLARDRYGIKPLYYYTDSTKFIFASEIKALLQDSSINVKVNKSALVEYFTFQNIFSHLTLFDQIQLLPAGHFLILSLKNNQIEPQPYWDYDFQSDNSLTIEDCTLKVLNLFEQAVNRQLLCDVEVGTYLSGGMDSGSVTAIAARSNRDLKTFTCGFDLSSASGIELAFDERTKSEILSAKFHTEQYEVVLKAGDMEKVMPSLIWHLEDLRMGQSYPNFFISRLASKFVKVVLCGTGGDELFAGYPWRYQFAFYSPDPHQFIENYFNYWHRLIPQNYLPFLFNGSVNEELERSRSIFEKIVLPNLTKLSDPKAQDYLNLIFRFEAKTFLHGLLVMEDKLSMAHSLETRVPFLDNDLVDFALKIPPSYKLNLGEQKVQNTQMKFDGKLILRKALSQILPTSFTEAVKQGFSAPDASWFRGQSIDYIRDLLGNKNARIYEFLNYDFTLKLLNEHFAGKTNHRLLIWSLLCFEWWNRIYRP